MSGVDYPFATVSVSTTAVFLFTTAPCGAQAFVKNRGPVTVYLGGSAVTADEASTGGYPLEPGEVATIPSPGNVASDNPNGLDLYAITAADSAYVSWIAV